MIDRQRKIGRRDGFISEDYVGTSTTFIFYKTVFNQFTNILDLLFEKHVWPTHVQIFEVYNPGAVVRILACDTSPEERKGSVDISKQV